MKPWNLTRNEVITLYQAGTEVERIAEMAGRSPSAVWNALKRWGVPLRSRPDQQHAQRRLADIDWLRRRWVDDGAPVMAIASEAGVHSSTVRERLALHGLFDLRTGARYQGSEFLAEPLSEQERQKLKELYRQEGSIAGVARLLGRHPRSTRVLLLRAGVKLNRPGRHPTSPTSFSAP